MPGASVADIDRLHEVTRWQIYDWRRKLRSGQLAVSEAVAALPMFAELAVEGSSPDTLAATEAVPGLEIMWARS